MSKSESRATTTGNRTNIKRSTNLPTTTSATTTATTSSRNTKPTVKKQNSTETDRVLPKSSKTTATNVGKLPLPVTKNKEREAVATKRTTPSPTTKALRVGKQPPRSPATAVKSKPNAVLDTFHNVTVSSPPQKRKEQAKQQSNIAVSDAWPKSRPRTFTRTLAPEESELRKRELALQQQETEIQLKKPVAFEVNFETPKVDSEVDNYSDDFESYESDFETGSSTPEDYDDNDNDEDPQKEEAELEDEADHEKNKAPTVAEDDEEDSELTHNPITVIQRIKEQERTLDSGHFDMHVRPPLVHSSLSSQSTLHQFDSFDTYSTTNSDHLDSGVSSYGTVVADMQTIVPSVASTTDTFYGGYADFIRRPVITQRGIELMSKLRLDHLQYDLFDMKPLSYDNYMQSYGKLNTCQTATQTQVDRMDSESQTVTLNRHTSWTQHPPYYGPQLQLVSNSCADDTVLTVPSSQNDPVEKSLAHLSKLQMAKQQRAFDNQRSQRNIDFERLNVFLHNASLLVGKVLGIKRQTPLERKSLAKFSQGYTVIPTLLDALRVRRVFASAGQQLIVTVHECPPQSDVYREDFANLLMIWSLSDMSQPIRLLSTWSEISRVCIEAPEIVVAGLRDGSVALWDLRETYSYCSKLDGHLTHFAATHSITPSIEHNAAKWDVGAVLDVRTFRAPPKSGLLYSFAVQTKAIQYTSLHDSGVVTVWTVVETAASLNSGTPAHEYTSPWARVKLMQSAICDLRGYIEKRQLKTESAYEKTQLLFQNNIYSDKVLRELNETQDHGMQGLRFTGIDTSCDRIYICTNRSFIMACTKSLKPERFTRIALNESRYLFPTALCVLSNEDFLAVGFSNGSVMIINCNERQHRKLPPKPQTGPATHPDVQIDPDIGKSCAIQNIILNERRSFEESTDSYDIPRPNTAAYIDMIHQPKRSYELRVYDQQLLLSGSILRQHLVHSLVLSSDGWRLFVLTNGSVRTYDFYLDKELAEDDHDGRRSLVTDIAVTRSTAEVQHLVVLNDSDEIQLHTLN